jgi:transcription initiation factor TFIIB
LLLFLVEYLQQMTDCQESLWNLFDSFDESVEIKAKEYIKIKNNSDINCESCKGTNIMLDEGNYVCECGTILSRFIDMGAEWRFYGSEDNKFVDPTRCGMITSELLPNSSLGSTIGYLKHESHDIYIMRKYHMWNSMSYKERSLYNIFDTLTINAVNNGIPKNIIEEAKSLYKNLSDKKISRGDNRNGLIASSIYISCKNNKVPRSAKEIAKIFNLNIPTMTRGCKKFQEIMNMSMNSTNAEDFVFRFCSKLNIDKSNSEICKNIVKKIEEYEILSDSTPPSLAAGSIYMCNHFYNWGITKKDLAFI